MTIFHSFLAVLFLFVSMMTPNAAAQAQGIGFQPSGSVAAPAATAEQTLAQTLRDAARDGVSIIVIDAEGRIITEDITAAAQAQTPPPATRRSALMKAQENADLFRDALIERLSQLPVAVNEVLYILRAASPDGTIMRFIKILGLSLLLFAIGVVVEREVFGKRLVKRFVTSRVMAAPSGYAQKMPFLVFRFFMGVIGILVSMSVAYVIGVIFFPPIEDSAEQFTITLINAGYFGCRFTAGLWRMILSPFLTQYRIPIFSDRDAKRLHLWMWTLGSFDICAILFGIWIAELGLNYDVYALVAATLSAVVVLLNVLLVLVNGRAISSALRHGKQVADVSVLVRVLSRAWAPAVIIYVFFAWFGLTYDLILNNPSSIPLIAGAYGILISIIVVYGVVNYVIERSFARARMLRLIRGKQAARESSERLRQEASARALLEMREEGPDPDEPQDAAQAPSSAPASTTSAPSQPLPELTQAERELLSTTAGHGDQPTGAINSFEALARRVAGIMAFVAGAYAFFYIWDNDGARMVESIFDRLLNVIIIVFVGYVVYETFRIWIDSKIAEETADDQDVEPGDEGGASSASRLATLLPLFRNFTLIMVVVTIGLIGLMELGINVGPLFAGAGIVGIAVGFGSQALVRDIFAGAFFLFDDAFRKGEYLDVGDVKGTVEKISVRSFQLRHHLGALHTIPFGELQVMTNYSRDWVIMKLPLRVTYDTDVEKVRKLIKNLGIALLDDPVIGQNFIQPLKSQGVIEMQDSAMIIRVKFMTKPGDQFLIRKRVYEEIRALFEQEGIKFAHREVTVRLTDGKVADLSEDEKQKVAAAAQASIEEATEDAQAAKTGDNR